MNKLEQLKSELKEIEYGCRKELIYYKPLVEPLICGEILNEETVLCPTCQAKMEYLKKGISACEETLEQRNKEILEKIDDLKGEILSKINDALDFPHNNGSGFYWLEDRVDELIKELKKQLTTSGEKK